MNAVLGARAFYDTGVLPAFYRRSVVNASSLAQKLVRTYLRIVHRTSYGILQWRRQVTLPYHKESVCDKLHIIYLKFAIATLRAR